MNLKRRVIFKYISLPLGIVVKEGTNTFSTHEEEDKFWTDHAKCVNKRFETKIESFPLETCQTQCKIAIFAGICKLGNDEVLYNITLIETPR